MKKLTTTILACGFLASGLYQASAAPTLRLSSDGGATWTLVEDNGPLDINPSVGAVTFIGPVAGWDVSIDTGFGLPLTGSAISPRMDVGTSSDSSGPATLILQLSDTNFIGFPNETFIAQSGGFAGGTATYTAYKDSGNLLFGTTATYTGGPAGLSPSPTASSIITQGPSSGDYQNSNSVVVPVGSGTYSLTLEMRVIHTAAAHSSADSSLAALPPPQCNCTLNFTSPVSLTNCADDTIPNATAIQDCGSGPVAATVTVVGAVTNGICPQIITRTNSATDNCGMAHTFVQTIRVNCKPDCTITLSDTNVVVGGSNYTASVANAGPGATYVWNILNGFITAGQGTNKITWAPGTDTTSPVTIVVTITSGTGCTSTCSAGARLCPKPPQSLGHGDTATIGFWHNKNGQGLIVNAPGGATDLANWLASNFPCLYGALAGKSNQQIADFYSTQFGISGQKTYAQIMAGAFACYFTSSNLGGNNASAKFGFNVTPGGTGGKLFNVGNLGTTIGLSNNTSYTILQILQAANTKCPFGTSGPVFDALNTIFDGINSSGDIK